LGVRTDLAGERVKHALRDVASGFQAERLLVEAGAIAFRCLLALITGALCVLGLLGLFGLDALWTGKLMPQFRGSVSPPAFALINDAVLYVLTQQQLFWATAGLALAVWQASSVVRAAGELLNRIHDLEETRSWKRVMLSSIGLGAALLVTFTAAVAAMVLGQLGVEQLLGSSAVATSVGEVARWSLAAALLLIAVGLVVRGAPNTERRLRWIALGSALVVVGWLVTSLLFGLYLTKAADFSTVFGNLATVFLLVEYLFVGSLIFLVGLLLNAALERRSGS
jgi:membrane protein